MFSIHLHSNSITALNCLGIEVDFILAGYTPVLQPMDKGIHNAQMVAHQQGDKPMQVDRTLQHGFNMPGT
jgi:molecular chaperone GrpE (heat shock protein)